MYILKIQDFENVTSKDDHDVVRWRFKNGDIIVCAAFLNDSILLNYISNYSKEHDCWTWATTRPLSLQDMWSTFARHLADYNIVCTQEKALKVTVLPLPDMEPPCT